MSYSKRLFLLFAATSAVLLISFAVLFFVGVVTIFENQTLQAHEALAEQLNQAFSTVKDAEAGQRGYLLTGDGQYLRTYQTAAAQIHTQLDGMGSRAGRRNLIPDDVAKLRRLVDEKLNELQEMIDLRDRSGLDAAASAARSRGDIEKMTAVGNQISRMVSNERGKLAAAQVAAAKTVTYRGRLFLVILLVNMVYLYWAYRRLKREIAAREITALEVQRQKDLLAVTLGSIGDAVIVTDPQGNITYVNEVAESLTGWKLAEARGGPCTRVFHIINEETREAADSPVEKVLRGGVIVGLANHTLLIRKDGTEIPIDDSGAPIRDRDGTVRGVVLIFRDFSKHKEVERTLRAAKHEVETASRAKDQFLASLSHELRTPLTPVLGMLTAWDVNQHVPASFASDVQMMRRNVELEARLIDDLLDLTRIARGKLALNLEVADVHELVHAAADTCAADIRARRIDLSFFLNATRRHANVDPARLQQVLWNVLKNATKFTSEGGSIRIQTADDADGRLEISIADNGIGMSADVLGRVFRPFDQGADDITRRFGGLGLGLAISKALLDAQEGTITAQSAGEKLGSTFKITLPAVPAPIESATTPAPASPANLPGERRRLKILLVEDHEDTADVLGRVLRGSGHEVEISGSIAAATQSVDAREFDLLLSDIGLPDGTGIELIRHVRQRFKMPAIALTGFGMEEDIAKCREAGFDAHLTKPISFQKLDLLIGQIVQNHNC